MQIAQMNAVLAPRLTGVIVSGQNFEGGYARVIPNNALAAHRFTIPMRVFYSHQAASRPKVTN
jgi:hypothetical protein